MDYAPNWKPPTDHPNLDISFAVVNEAINLVSTQVADLAEAFPVRNSSHTKLRLDDGWVGLILQFSNSPGIPSIGELGPADVAVFGAAAQSALTGTYHDLRAALGPEYYSFTKFSYLGPWRDGMMSWPHLMSHLVTWMNDLVVPEVLRRNQARVLRAIPQPPQINIGQLTKQLWVLECDEVARQGTGFMLKGAGLVTCAHVLGPQTRAFRADSPSDKRSVTVERSEEAIDLAILKVDGLDDGGLDVGSADGLKQMDHLVICGYPNYRVGDTGTVVPGLVVGFRPVAGIRRILTNAPIVGGASGAPAIDASGRVIGVAVTGADRMESAQSTEDHGIIPIDALRFLRGPG